MAKVTSGAGRQTYSVDEAAPILGVGRTTLYSAVARGEVPAIRIGGRWIISRLVIEALLKKGLDTITTAETEPAAGPVTETAEMQR